jgi:hypothetical protein
MALTRVTSQVLDANAVSSIKLANGAVTARNFANLSVELRHLAPDANVAAVHADLTTNVNLLQTNVNLVQSNANVIQTNVNAAEANVRSATANSIQNAANVVTLLANVVQLNSNINVVHANANGITDDATVIFNVEKTFADDVIITGNLTVNGDTITANSINMVVEDRMMMLANSVTGAPSADVGVLFNRGNQGNAAFFYDESGKTFKIADTKDPSSNTTLSPVTLGNLAVGALTFNGADLNTAITDNVNTLTTNINTLDANADAIDTRAAANVLVAASNDFVTYTRLNANINVVQDNIVASTGMIPFVNVITTAGSNAVGMGVDTTSDANVVTVTLDGVVQPNTEFVMNHTTNVLQFKDAAIPSGTIVTVFTLA